MVETQGFSSFENGLMNDFTENCSVLNLYEFFRNPAERSKSFIFSFTTLFTIIQENTEFFIVQNIKFVLTFR